MAPIPELEWPQADTEFQNEVRHVKKDWRRVAPCLASQVTPATARSLSIWAKTEMKRYTAVPPLEKLALTLTGQNQSQHKLLFEGTIDTLKSHKPDLVIRWLKLYLVYDQHKKRLVDAIVTIRGVRLE